MMFLRPTVTVRSSNEGPLLSASNIYLKKADLQIERQERQMLSLNLAEADSVAGKRRSA